MRTAGDLIRGARQRQRLSARDVAQRVGLTEHELFMIEDGAMTLWSDSAWSLARTLGLDIEQLCEAAALAGLPRV